MDFRCLVPLQSILIKYFKGNILILNISFINFFGLILPIREASTLGMLRNRIWVYTAKSLQSCPTLCNPVDGSPPGSNVPGIVQARTLEWVAIYFSKAWMWKVKVKSLSRVRLFATPWIAAYQAPPSMGFSRQEYWSGVYTTRGQTLNYDTLTITMT